MGNGGCNNRESSNRPRVGLGSALLATSHVTVQLLLFMRRVLEIDLLSHNLNLNSAKPHVENRRKRAA